MVQPRSFSIKPFVTWYQAWPMPEQVVGAFLFSQLGRITHRSRAICDRRQAKACNLIVISFEGDSCAASSCSPNYFIHIFTPHIQHTYALHNPYCTRIRKPSILDIPHSWENLAETRGIATTPFLTSHSQRLQVSKILKKRTLHTSTRKYCWNIIVMDWNHGEFATLVDVASTSKGTVSTNKGAVSTSEGR
jgi:hypothetical protein